MYNIVCVVRTYCTHGRNVDFQITHMRIITVALKYVHE